MESRRHVRLISHILTKPISLQSPGIQSGRYPPNGHLNLSTSQRSKLKNGLHSPVKMHFTLEVALLPNLQT